ncbi:Rpn family recombination-promoting nuclease/putative transposase [Syntrophomonas wolfei]|uniref:Rpn family recombination-promoting nuclease/putative transposase n=1 Tax=Syntrophomonas wolfei TaxID=863 RepID=UPI0023F349DC|nr:Rpn family recombination-promoting nuclease/putative transposase [Syntrophomonas wolfei]
MIIPLVVYHGKDRWKIGTTLGEMITGYEDLPEAIKNLPPTMNTYFMTFRGIQMMR